MIKKLLLAAARRFSGKRVALIACASVGLGAVPAQATLVLDITEVGPDVMTVYSGSLDLTGLSRTICCGHGRDLMGSPGLYTGAPGRLMWNYTGFAGPSPWGPGTRNVQGNDDFWGNPFAINAAHPSDGLTHVWVDRDYVSGTPLVGFVVFAGESLASVGLTPGTYVYTATNNETIVVNIRGAEAGAVPEPSTWALMIAGFCLIGAAMRRRSKVPAFGIPSARRPMPIEGELAL